MSGSPLEAVAAAIDDAIWLAMGQHEPLKNDSVCTCGVSNNMDGDVLFSHRYGVVSDAANAALVKGLAALELREEWAVVYEGESFPDETFDNFEEAQAEADTRCLSCDHCRNAIPKHVERRWVSSWTSGSEQ